MSVSKFGSAREFVKCPIWRGLECLRPAAGCRLARQSLYSEPQIQRWRPVSWGRTFHASSRSRKEPSHPIDSSWVGSPARLIAGTLGGTGIPHRAPWLGRRVPTKAAGIPWSPNGENRSIPRRLKNLECCPQTRPLSSETLRPGRPSLASQSSRIKPFKPEPNERIGLYSFLRRAFFPLGRRRRNSQSSLQKDGFTTPILQARGSIVRRRSRKRRGAQIATRAKTRSCRGSTLVPAGPNTRELEQSRRWRRDRSESFLTIAYARPLLNGVKVSTRTARRSHQMSRIAFSAPPEPWRRGGGRSAAKFQICASRRRMRSAFHPGSQRR
jgi:hypothetical protein